MTQAMAYAFDTARETACTLIERARQGHAPRPVVQGFFDEDSCTVSYVVRDPDSDACAVLDSVLGFDQASGKVSAAPARPVIDHVRVEGLGVRWLLETHAHADHLSAGPYLQKQLGGELAIGQGIRAIQRTFGTLFNEDPAFARDGSQFDHLFGDGDSFRIGGLEAVALHVPGHTPACLAYVIGDAVFAGDTLFMPDYGTARCDFPGGDAGQLYRSIRRLLSLPEAARVFVCHDYKAPGRDVYAWETTIGAQRQGNVHVHDGIDEATFTTMRTTRDATLAVPRLMLPSVQVNMRAGHLPPAESNGVSYLKLPLIAGDLLAVSD